MINKKHNFRHPSSFWHFLESSGCHWKRNGKFTDIYGDVSFKSETGKRLRLPASLRFHGNVKVTQTNRLSPNIIFASDFCILPVAIGTIDEKRRPRLRIPGNTQFMSSVFLNTWHGQWPENIRIIRGHFFWTYSYIRKLPDVFSVEGDINLSGSKIKQFPTELTVHGDAIMPGIQVQSLPDRMNLSQSLGLSFSTPEALPAGLNVPGDLRIKNTRIRHLPDDLSVGGNLNMTGTQISHFPETIFIGGAIIRDKGHR